MNRFTYGKPIDFRFIPLEGGEQEVTAYSLVSARIYEDEPTEAQLVDAGSATTGHIERVLSWSLVNDEFTGAKEYKISFAALVDANPTFKSTVDRYYVAVNFKYDSASQEVFNLEQIFVHRPDFLTDKIRVTADQVLALDSTIAEVAPSDLWIEEKIDAAIEFIQARLLGLGYEKRRVFDWQHFNPCARRLAYSYCCFALARDNGSHWTDKGATARAEFEEMFSAVKVSYDFDNDDQPDTNEKATGGATTFIR